MSEKPKHKEMGAAQKYLSSIKECDMDIDGLIREREQLYASITRITQVLKEDIVKGGSGQNDRVEEWIDMARMINQKIDSLYDLKKEAKGLLQKVKATDETYYQILNRRYILYDTLEQISVDLHYGYRWICKLHGRALQAFEKVMNEKKEG